jgi:MoaA/NifB/PqqE/SkfB family radical SAM enzyme
VIGKGPRLAWSMLWKKPILCLWQITGRCQFSCRICDFWREAPDDDLDLEACATVLRGLRKVAPLMVSLAGGEPFLREDLPELVHMASRDHFCGIITNGYLVTREKAQAVWAAGLTDAVVSLDFTTPARHDEQRGREGAFSRALAAVEHFQSTRPGRGHQVRFNTVVMEENRDELAGVLLLAEELGVSVSFTLYSDRLGHKAHRAPTSPISAQLLELRRRHPRRVDSSTAYLAKFDQALSGGVPGCHGGRTFLNINPLGQLSRCIDRNDEPVLNMLSTPPKAVARALRSSRHPDCQGCFTACRALGDVSTGMRGLGAARENLRARR